MRVLQLSKELEIKPKELIKIVEKLGIQNISHHTHELSDIEVDMIRRNFVKEPEPTKAKMKKAFGIDKVNGKWGVVVFEYEEGDMSSVRPLQHIINESGNYKSESVFAFNSIVEDVSYSDILREEE